MRWPVFSTIIFEAVLVDSTCIDRDNTCGATCGIYVRRCVADAAQQSTQRFYLLQIRLSVSLLDGITLMCETVVSVAASLSPLASLSKFIAVT